VARNCQAAGAKVISTGLGGSAGSTAENTVFSAVLRRRPHHATAPANPALVDAGTVKGKTRLRLACSGGAGNVDVFRSTTRVATALDCSGGQCSAKRSDIGSDQGAQHRHPPCSSKATETC